VENTLAEASQSIQNYASEHGYAGYVEASLLANPGKLTVYWHGPVPSDVSSHALSAAGDDAVIFTHVPYSMGQMMHEAQKIASANYPGVVSVGPASDFSSIVVHVDTSRMPLDQISIQSSIPLSYEGKSGGGAVPLFRDADGPPFSGGAWIADPNDDLCSTGYTVTLPGGGRGITTANHCSPPGTVWNSTGTPIARVGTTLKGSPGTDIEVLTGGESYQHLIYKGAWNSGVGVIVVSASNPTEGQPICDGGGLTGEVCNMTVTSINQFLQGGIGPGYFTFTNAGDGNGASGPGDSGGPSYSYKSDGFGIIAHGTIADGILGTEAPCPASTINLPRTCYKENFHPNITQSMTALNAKVATP
jgi:hypothetical protein